MTATSKDGRGRKRTVGYRVQIPDKTRPKKPNGRYPSITKRFKLAEKELAQQWLTREVAYLEDCMLKGVPYISATERQKQHDALAMTFSSYARQWLAEYRSPKTGERISPASIRALAASVSHLIDFFENMKDDELLCDITAQDCKECSKWMRNTAPSDRGTASAEVSVLLPQLTLCAS